jgi:hypothetical protein
MNFRLTTENSHPNPVYLARMVLFLASDDAAICATNNYMVEAGSI